MLSYIVENLKTKEILNAGNVQAIRDNIKKKYPHYSKEQAARIFAEEIRKIINNNIIKFNEQKKKEIRETVIRLAVSKKSFIINGDDIFNACISSVEPDEHFVQTLTEWINENQELHVTEEIFSDIYSGLYIDAEVAVTIDTEMSKCEVDINTDISRNEIKKTNSFKVYHKYFYASLKEKSIEFCNILSRITYRKLINKQALAIFVFIMILFLGVYITQLNSVKLAFAEENSFDEIIPTHSMNDTYLYNNIIETKSEQQSEQQSEQKKDIKRIENGLHKDLKFENFDKAALKKWLEEKKSLLADEPYFSTIIVTAEENNINPLLLFAIAGQEQSFVPKNSQYAKKIANNPFNVFHSWKEYNTNIADSSNIAAKTIIKLSQKRPANIHPLEWINRKYAEDKSWWKGVNAIFEELVKETM